MMGVSNAELWNNLGLACFYASQYDTALRCLENALLTGDDQIQADVWCAPPSPPLLRACGYRRRDSAARSCFAAWLKCVERQCRYNVSHIAITIGDKQLATQTLTICTSLNRQHAEALNNLAILAALKGRVSEAADCYRTAQEFGPLMLEPHYNGALAAFKGGELDAAYRQVKHALSLCPDHTQSKELERMIEGIFAMA